jgi:aspartyl protease family protein
LNQGDQALNFIYLAGVLLLVVSAVAAQRMPLSRGLKIGAVWLLLFGAVFAVFVLADDFTALGRRLIAAAGGESVPVESGGTVRVKMAEDGHFWIDGKLNGKDATFLVDSGATMTSLSVGTAKDAGVEYGGLATKIDTANGLGEAQRGTIAKLEVGSIVRSGLPVHVSAGFGETNVLGMNFLSSLSGWGVEGNWLVLKP